MARPRLVAVSVTPRAEAVLKPGETSLEVVLTSGRRGTGMGIPGRKSLCCGREHCRGLLLIVTRRKSPKALSVALR